MKFTFVSTTLAALTISVASQSVEFFYTDTIDLCSFNGDSIPATDETTHGGLCAYRTDTGRVYACPAPDPTCWTYYQGCVNGESDQQITCNENGAVWCCASGETCTTTANQINVCIGNFTSPNSGVSVADANAKYLATLGVSNITATSQTADPTPFSTRQLAKSTSAVTTSTSSGTSSTTSSTQTSSAPSTSTTSTSSATSSSTSSSAATVAISSSGSGITGGAIGGIVIGVLALIAIVGAGFFFLGRRHKNKTQGQGSNHPFASEIGTSAPVDQKSYNPVIGELPEEKRRYLYSSNTSELGTDGQSRVEMPSSDWRSPTRHEMA